MTTYPFESLLEIAFAAHRVNNGYVKQTVRFDNNDAIVLSNKEIVSYTALVTLQDKNLPPAGWIPEDFKPVEVNDEDRTGVQEAHRFFRRYTMLILGDSLNQFQKDMFSAYSNMKDVPYNKVGYVAYIPAFIKQEAAEIAYQRRLKDNFSNSRHFNTKEVTGDADILKRIYLNEHNTHMYVAGIGENLVSFAKKELYEVGTIYHLRAKVKNTSIERSSKLAITKLNYVKLKPTKV